VRLSTDKQTGDALLLFPEGVVHLSPTAQAILSRCDGQATTRAIIAALADEFEAEPGELKGDVIECLAQLHSRKLIVFKT
jgi:pyrroloquinoline quinone biosynthesis protein D